MKIEPNKKYVTRDGSHVNIVHISQSGVYPVLAIFDYGDTEDYTITGSFYSDNRECPFDLVAMAEPIDEPTDIKKLLEDVKGYIENAERIEDGEWGSSRSVEQIISDGDMPELYNQVIQAISKL
jgi:hypothetical protein